MRSRSTTWAALLAITASTLALVAGGYQVWRGLKLVTFADEYSGSFCTAGYYTRSFNFLFCWLAVEAGLSLAAAIMLVIGVLCVLARISMGRWLVVGGCAVIVEHTIIGAAVMVKMHHWFVLFGAHNFASHWFNTPNAPVMAVLSFVVPVLSATLVWLPVMRSWWYRWWSISSLKQAASTLRAYIRAGLRPPFGTAGCDPGGRPANLTNPSR